MSLNQKLSLKHIMASKVTPFQNNVLFQRIYFHQHQTSYQPNFHFIPFSEFSAFFTTFLSIHLSIFLFFILFLHGCYFYLLLFQDACIQLWVAFIFIITRKRIPSYTKQTSLYIIYIPSNMFSNTPQIHQTLSYLHQLLDQNQSDKHELESSTQINEPLFNILEDKIQLLQYITEVAISAIQCVSDLKEQKDGLEAETRNLKDDLKCLSQINANLENRVEDLMLEVQQQGEQLEVINRKQEVLEIEKSQIRKQLESNKAKLEQAQQKQRNSQILQEQQALQRQVEKAQQIINNSKQQDREIKKKENYKGKENNQNQVKKFQKMVSIGTSMKQQLFQRKAHNYTKMMSFQKQFQQLKETTNILRKKVSFDEKRPKKSLKSLNSLSALSCHFPKLRTKTKQSQNSQNSIKMSRSGLDQSKKPGKSNLADELAELNFTSCNSIIEQTPVPSNSKIEESPCAQQTNQSICQKYEFRATADDDRDKWKKTNPYNGSSWENTKKSLFKRKYQDPNKIVADSEVKSGKQKECLCGYLIGGFQKAHAICFKYIVQDRIQPRRAIQKRKAQIQQINKEKKSK